MGDNNKQYDGQLIDDYYMLIRIRREAVKANAVEVVQIIDEEINRIKLKLQPLELPELPEN